MSTKTVFISYRRDPVGKAFARSIKQELQRHGYDVFFDVDSIDAGKWASQILTEVPVRAHFLLLLTPGALDRCVDRDDWVRREFEAALQSGRNIVPIREESVDLKQLQQNCPDAMKGLFDFQIATVRQDGFENDIEDLIARYIPPHKAPNTAPIPGTVFQADISRLIKYAPAELIGREADTKLLDDAWAKVQKQEPKRAHILTFVALGGEGKTSLVAKWAADLSFAGWPGCDAAFARSFYSQGTREEVVASSDLFLKEALTFFGDDADKEFAASNAGAYEKGQRLARIVGSNRNLLLLDGVEPLQYAPTSPTPGELKDVGLAALLKGLATASKGLCVVTTRYSISDLKAFWQTTARQVELTRLSREAGVYLLKTLGVNGTTLEFETLVEDVKGHALTLNLLATFLRDAHGGDIRKRDLVKLEEADAEEQGGHAFHVMNAYVKSFESEDKNGQRALGILRLLGLFDRPVTADLLRVLCKAPRIENLTELLVGITEAQRNIALSRLESAKLLTVNRDLGGSLISLDAHPLLREYFASRLRNRQEGAWRAAHKRIYKHLIATTHEGKYPTLEDLEPLYAAIAHGCEAGRQEEACEKVYLLRILKGDEFYSRDMLGANASDLGAVACFFDRPWNRISPALKEEDQAFLLNEAAVCLRALGRLTEALEPIRAAISWAVKAAKWHNAAAGALNLSGLELTLGEVTEAVTDGEQSLTFADLTTDKFLRMAARTGLGKALHDAGFKDLSEIRFRQAEKMQEESQPQYPTLYSVQGFDYCELLLDPAERAAWRLDQYPRTTDQLLGSCRAISERAAQLHEWAVTGGGPRDIALSQLTLGRSMLYGYLLNRHARAGLESEMENICTALDGLRRINRLDYLPLGLLSRAWLRFLKGVRTGAESAQEDLDAAWEIAERGPMRLYMADIHLYRARLFGPLTVDEQLFDEERKYPWNVNPDGSERGPKDDLAAARKLIQQCGYWRRKEELEDAEEASKNW